MSTSRVIRFLAVTAGVAMLAVACGGGNDDDDAAADCPEASTSVDASGVIALDGTDDGSGGGNCFDFTTLEVTAGEEVTVDFTNSGTVAHTFTIPDWDVDTDLIDAGESAPVTFTVPADASGDVGFICTPHESLGMVGTMQVAAA